MHKRERVEDIVDQRGNYTTAELFRHQTRVDRWVDGITDGKTSPHDVEELLEGGSPCSCHLLALII